MKAIALLYHDVVERGSPDTSGFPGRAAGLYKLSVDAFGDHMQAVARVSRCGPATAPQLMDGVGAEVAWLLTFDDGGISAYTPIADLLEERGWRGHFFVTTDYIGSPGFLNRAQIRDLRRRGHVIGSHSASHPMRMSARSWETLVHEWKSSAGVLADVLGEEVSVASVPGGFFSKKVARAASAAGIRVLFTSEPTTQCQRVDQCLVVGRYSLRTGTPARIAADIVRGRQLPRVTRWLSWNARKVAKTLGGEMYLRAWRLVLGEPPPSSERAPMAG